MVQDGRITNDLGNAAHRRNEVQRDVHQERLLAQLNRFLESAIGFRPHFDELRHAPVFIMGCPRSGSTLVTQDIAMRGTTAYPTNLMSRFYGDPWVGALAHRVLFDLDQRGEVFPVRPEPVAASDLGKTLGADAPHEFWYWWRRYFHFEHDHGFVPKVSREMRERFRSDLAGMTTVFEKPMVFKAMIMNWNIPLLHEIVPEALFIVLERDLEANACSLLKARDQFYGDRNEWWAFRPPEIDQLLGLDPLEQVFAQVKLTNDAVRLGASILPQRQVLHWKYKDFCEGPARHHAQLMERLGVEVAPIPGPGHPYPVRRPQWPAEIPADRVCALVEKYLDRNET